MRYQISGKQIDIGEALQTHVETELGTAVSKYAGRPTDALVVFSKSGHEFVCEATIHLSTGLTAAAKAHETEIYAAFDSCAQKMEKQLRRYKRRLKDHHKERAEPVEQMGASSYILASESDADAQEPESGNVLLAQGQSALSADKMSVRLADGTAQMSGRVRTTLQTGGKN